jgi:hypothetical protein
VRPGDLRASAGPAAGRALVRRRFVVRTVADMLGQLGRDRSAPRSTQRRPAHAPGIRWRARRLRRFHRGPPRATRGRPKPHLFVLTAKTRRWPGQSSWQRWICGEAPVPWTSRRLGGQRAGRSARRRRCWP